MNTAPIARLPLRRIAAPFSGFLRELIEMRYLWRVPLRLDNRKLLGRIGNEPHTPLDEGRGRDPGPPGLPAGLNPAEAHHAG